MRHAPPVATRARSGRLGRGLLGPLLALLLVAPLTGCDASDEEVSARVATAAREGTAAVASDLRSLLARARATLARTPDLSRLSPAARLDALHDLRALADVDGLLWRADDGTEAWAGRAQEPRPLPAPPPFERSFAHGDVSYHDGPFLKGLLVGPHAAGGGQLTVAVRLEATRPERPLRPFEERWLEPLGLSAVELLPPDATPPPSLGAPPEGVADVREQPTGPVVLRVAVRPLGPEATRDRLVAQKERVLGGLLVGALLLGAAAAAWVLRRRLGPGAVRTAAGVLLVLLVRGGLSLIDLPRCFPELGPGFSATDFGVEDPLGWLASPGDLLLTALAALLVARLVLRGGRRMLTPACATWPARTAGLAASVGAAALWLGLVRLAVEQGQTPFFESVSLLPPWPVGLMITALVAATAAGLLLSGAGLALAAAGGEGLRGAARRAGLALLAAGPAHLLAGTAWAPGAALLLPLASVLVRPPAQTSTREGRAGRALLLGVLATVLLFPVLWQGVAERRRDQLGAVLDHLLDHEATALLTLQVDLEELADDPRLVDGLLRARGGPRPEGLALALWRDTLLARPGLLGTLSVLDERGRLLDEFSLDGTPRRRMPTPAPPTGPHDVQVVSTRAEGGLLRCVVGRSRVRGSPGGDGSVREVVGHVVLTLPDPADLLLSGRAAGSALLSDDGALPARRRPLEVAQLVRGRVVASSAPEISREAGTFGPSGLAALSPEQRALRWNDARGEGAASWSDERHAVLAVRRRAADLGDVVLALSRLVVVGASLSAALALGVLLLSLRRLTPRLQHRILLSYVLISVVPLVLLAYVNVGEARTRHDERFTERLEGDLARTRGELEAQGAQVFDINTDEQLRRSAWERRHEVILYREGRVLASSRAGLVEAEVEADRLPAEAYRATVLERRQTVRREQRRDGLPVWIGYAPVLGADGRTLATVAVPLLYDKDRIDAELTVTGSVVLAGYLLTLVLVLALGIYSARLIARPLDTLARGAEQVARGNLEVVLPGEGRDELGQVVGSFNAMTRALAEATAKAAQAERETAWRRMARQVAHEIKNPLSPMKLMVQQLEADVRRAPDTAQASVARTAQVLLRQIDALSRIAGTFGELARLPVRRPVAVDVAALIRHVTDLHAGAQAHGVEVRAEAAPDLPRVSADEEELRRVLVNLVGNAVQAIPGPGCVTVAARPLDGPTGPGVAVEVRDTGTGITPEDQARLFEPYFSTKTSGTGLGLAIVKRILDDLGGTIQVDSAPGRGSTFRMWWPCKPPSAPGTPGVPSA